jgi:hypothetical protein
VLTPEEWVARYGEGCKSIPTIEEEMAFATAAMGDASFNAI